MDSSCPAGRPPSSSLARSRRSRSRRSRSDQGCYETTPHRAQVASSVAPKVCSNAITDVFARSGFIQLPTPPNLSMFFTARLDGPYNSFLRSGTGVGVTIDAAAANVDACHVTIEALSPDVGCSDMHGPFACGSGGFGIDQVTGGMVPAGSSAPSYTTPCPIVRPLICTLSYAPGSDNDAAVDELARRVQVALGPSGRVN
jgi:hypothetical protein